MKIEVSTKKEVEVVTLKVEAGVLYWEDATIDGVEDIEGALVPCRSGDLWCPLIDLDSGVIMNWEKGKTAFIHYKVCDAGSYYLLDEEGCAVLSIEDDYVPSLLCPSENGYGDYIIMRIDADGKIENWHANISDFQENED